jgi:non-specific serine/threonine protein kinase/serine/threonine-protein kinase
MRLARSYEQAGRVEEALKLIEEELPLRRKVFGAEDPRTLGAMRYLASVYMDNRKYAQAEPLLNELLTRARKSTDTNSELDSVLQLMSELRYRQKRYGEAEAFYRERIELGLREPGGETSETVLGARASLARLYSDWAWAERATNVAAAHERAIEGEKLLRETIAAREQDAKEDSWRKADRQSRLGGALSVLIFIDPALTAATREPKLVEAEATLQRAQSEMENDATTETKYCRDGIERVMRLYGAWPKPDKQAEWKQKLAAFDEAEAKKNKPVQR